MSGVTAQDLAWLQSQKQGGHCGESTNDDRINRIVEALADRDRLDALVNTPQLADFAQAVVLEAAHQRERWRWPHDIGKEPEDWLWLLGWLAGKATRAAREGDRDKALHHCISSAATLANWHAALTGADTGMRPGIDPAEKGLADALP